jgi:hypothetical protein
MAEKINLKKRLIGREDIDMDIAGTNEKVPFFSADGVQYDLTKLNASHIPLLAVTREELNASNVDTALSNINDKINNFSSIDGLKEDVTIEFAPDDTPEDIQFQIDAQKKNLNGHTLSFIFPASLNQNLDRILTWNDFFNGTVIISGTSANSKIAIYDIANLGSMFRIYRCQCEVIIRYFYFVHQNSEFAISAESTAALLVRECNFSGMADTDSYAVNKVASNIFVSGCNYENDGEMYPQENKGAGRNIGDIFANMSEIPPEGAYRLDGQTIYNCKKTYPDFWNYLEDFATNIKILSAEDYQSSVDKYGECLAFVIDSVEESVRLPLWNGYQPRFVEDLPVVGTGIGIGLDNPSLVARNELAFTSLRSQGNSGGDSVQIGNGAYNIGVTTDPANSGLIANISNVSEDKLFWYIQIFNAATQISMQQSAELAQQLQMKAQTDLQNTDANIDFVINTVEASDKSWRYEQYRSGKIIQRGACAAKAGSSITNTGVVVTLPVEFADTDYYAAVTIYSSGENNPRNAVATIYEKTTTTVYISIYDSATEDVFIDWYVEGKMAQK